jgi:trimeric autotransporter adhesin
LANEGIEIFTKFTFYLLIDSMRKLLLIVIFYSSSFKVMNAQIINTIVGNGIAGYSGDGGPATDAEIWSPSGVFVDKAGNIYISDGLNNRIRKVNTAGIISTIAGNGYNPGGNGGYSGDGGPATNAELYNPQSICTDPLGNVYIADWLNNRIRKVDTGGIISTIAGNGHKGFSGDGGAATACELWGPSVVCFDTTGNLYIADEGNSRVREVNNIGKIITVVGGGANYPGDGGPATDAQVGDMYGLFVSDSGNIYISCDGQARICKVNTSGILYTIAGNGIVGYSGDGGPATAAEFFDQAGLCVDAYSNVYIGDASNSRVRLVTQLDGIITTVAGDGAGGFSGDGGLATNAELSAPADVSIDRFNNLYITDYYNYRVREVTGITTTVASVKKNETIIIFPNPATQEINIQFSKIETGLAFLSISDITGREILNSQFKIYNSQFIVDVSSLSSGIYFANILINGQKYTRKFIKI